MMFGFLFHNIMFDYLSSNGGAGGFPNASYIQI